jgi:predicted amidohydrolase
MDWWTLVNRRPRAMENLCHVVAANQGARSLARLIRLFPWPGGSMLLVDFDGRILAQAGPGPGEEMVVASIDLAAQARGA